MNTPGYDHPHGLNCDCRFPARDAEYVALLRRAQEMLHEAIDGDGVETWQMEELASDIGDALLNDGGDTDGAG